MIPFEYDAIESKGYGYLAYKEDQETKVFDRRGKVVKLPSTNIAYWSKKDVIVIDNSTFNKSEYLFYKKLGKEMTEVYKSAFVEFVDENFIIQQKGKKGLMSSQLKIILPCNLDDLKVLPDANLIIAVKRDKYGCFDLKGKPILPFQYDEMVYFNNGLLLAVASGKEYLIRLK